VGGRGSSTFPSGNFDRRPHFQEHVIYVLLKGMEYL
jgi:hypothetical protein